MENPDSQSLSPNLSPPISDSPASTLDPDTLKEIVGFVLLAVGVIAGLYGIDHEWGRGWACIVGGIVCAVLGLMLLPDVHLPPPKDKP